MHSIITPYKQFVFLSENMLPLSARVDIILKLLGLKTCLRSRLRNREANWFPLKEWCSQLCYFMETDEEGFVYIAQSEQMLVKMKGLDLSFQPHEEQFGWLLGYPLCCCAKIARIGEVCIDDFEMSFRDEQFSGRYQLINPSKYHLGQAFISHVPCSPTCQNSLDLAEKFANFLIVNREEETFKPWLTELHRINHDF